MLHDGGGGRVITLPVTADIRETVTRSTMIHLFRKEVGAGVVEREIDRTELYIADEVFFTPLALARWAR